MNYRHEKPSHHKKLSEKEREEIVNYLDSQYDEIQLRAMQLFGIEKENEHHTITFKKAHNKFIFDKLWYEEILRIEEDHHRQMSAIFYQSQTHAT